MTKEYVRKIEINGFKFLYELLALSKGKLKVNEVPLTFKERRFGNSKLDIAIIWDFLVSIIHNLTLRLLLILTSFLFYSLHFSLSFILLQ